MANCDEQKQPVRVLLRAAKDRPVDDVVAELLDGLDARSLIKPDSKVAIKPNLCCEIADKIPYANTDSQIIDAVCRYVSTITGHVILVESDGMRYKADQVFDLMHLHDLKEKYGVELVNLSRDEQREIDHEILSGHFSMPASLLEADVLIDLPVLKTHALTAFTGAVKNLWGCVPAWDRILLHRYLDQLLADLVGLLKPQLSLMDGLLCTEGRGPTNGIPRRLDVLLASRDAVALDAAAMRLVGLDPQRARHLVLAAKDGHGVMDEALIELDGDWAAQRCQFLPAVKDWAIGSMDYMTRYRFFTYHILLNNRIFSPVRAAVNVLRKARIVR